MQKITKGYEQIVYADLNSDSISEMFWVGKGIPFYHVVFANNDIGVYDQWNFKDSIRLENSKIFVGNYDNDRYKELYVFTYKDDSLFLNVNEFFEPDGLRLDRFYISKVSVINGQPTSNAFLAGFYDKNGDGAGEFYFSIATGFGLIPRKMYSLDLLSHELCSSQQLGTVCQYPGMVDVNGDSKPEIFGMVAASGNYKTPVPYTDHSSWLMVFNKDLEFEFPPVEFPGFTNTIIPFPYFSKGIGYYILTFNTASADTSVRKPGILLYSNDGKLIRSKTYSELGINAWPHLFVQKSENSDKIYVFGDQIVELDEGLEIVKTVKSPLKSNYYTFIADLDFDGVDEVFLYSDTEEKLLAYGYDLEKRFEIDFSIPAPVINFSHLESKNGQKKLFMSAGGNGFYLTLEKNKYFYLLYAVYPLLYFVVFIFILIIRKINTVQIENREGIKRRLITFQLQGIKSQLDPHFTFNTLNSVASLIYSEERQAAYDYMTKFTQLLRAMLNDAEKIYRSLSEEIEFVTMYLELEKLRFGEKFNYSIEIGPDLTGKEQVPKLVLQTFAENAIKHGILPCSSGGFLKIMVTKENEYLKITIEDNGIGREMAAGRSNSTGKGLKLTGEFYDILNQLNKKPILHNITDLHSESGKSAGTRVEVWVPVE